MLFILSTDRMKSIFCIDVRELTGRSDSIDAVKEVRLTLETIIVILGPL